MHNVYLFQPNYQVGHGEFTSLWLPYSVATVWTYVEQFEEIRSNFEVKDCIFKRELLDDVINRLEDPAVCLFSNYIWNETYNLCLAREIKIRWPTCKIIFGGPQVDELGFNFIIRNPFVDSVIINEGEVSLHCLLIDFLEGNLKKVYQIQSRVELENLPSPFIDSDILNKIIKDNPGTKWATTIESNRGCPFACTFCDWGSLTQSKVTKFNLDKVFKELDWIVANGIEYVYFADANFGIFYERDKEIVQYIAKLKKETGYPHNVNATWYKNSAEKIIELVSILHKVGLNRGLTLSVQSMNDKTLETIERKNMEISKLSFMYKECDRQEVTYYTEFILGMPYETKETWRHGLCKAVEAGCHYFLDIYPLEILKNSKMATQLDQFDLEIFKFTTIHQGQPSKIPEQHHYVVSTNSMSRQEYIDSWMWSWLILNFHHYGWTQILSKFAYKYLKKDYLDFYEEFLESCVFKNKIFFDLYYKQESELKSFFWNTNSTKVFDNDTILVISDQIVWHKNRDQVLGIINSWARQYFSQIDQALIDELLKFSNLAVVNCNRKNAVTCEFHFNFHEYCSSDLDFKHGRIIYEFSNTLPWDHIDDFKDKLFYKNRSGFSLQKIKPIIF
jgi:hypothetical protein